MQPPSTANRSNWPPDYVSVWAWRQQQLLKMRKDPKLMAGAKAYYSTRPVEFICHWADTYDPRKAGTGTPTHMPFILFDRQADMVRFLMALLDGQENGLMEKCRDAGATWVCIGFSVWLWLFRPGVSVGWGSRKEQLVDRIGDPDSIFEKIRMLIRRLPREFLPAGFNEKTDMPYMKVVNPESDGTITGEGGDNIGRGGRKTIYFKDESAHYERPEKIEAALGDNTNVQVDISSVNGLGNVFHRRREAGQEWLGGPAHKGKTSIFIMDWRDHPDKTQDWYETRKAKAKADGLSHIFAQEVDRNYAASVVGTIIPAEWITSAVDAHLKLGLHVGAKTISGLDVADGGLDRNAQAFRTGILLTDVFEWGDRDTGVTTRHAIENCEGRGKVELQYDNIGIGAGVKSEANRLNDEDLMPAGITMTGWCAAAAPLFPDEHYDPEDDGSPLNKDFYGNLKAQAWWQLRRRFERTHRAITEGIKFDPDDLISISSKIPLLQTIKKELAQPVAKRSTNSMKLIVDKTPPGTKSPNCGDAIVMAFWPVFEPEFSWEGAL